MKTSFRLHVFYVFFGVALSACSLDTPYKALLGQERSLLPKLKQFTNLNQDLFIPSSSLLVQWFPAEGENVSYHVETFSSADCIGTPDLDSTTTDTSHLLSNLLNGETYSIRLTAMNQHGMSESLCSPNIIVDMQAPSLTTIQPGAPIYIAGDTFNFSWSADDGAGAGLKNADTYHVELFNNGTCTGTSLISQLQTSSWKSWSGLSDSDSYSVRITAYDAVGNTSATCTDTVSVNHAGMTIELKDPYTHSLTVTNQTTVDITITGDQGATKWCLSETQTTPPADGLAVCSGTGWQSLPPQVFNLSNGDGLKTVYAYFADAFGNVSAAATAQIMVNTQVPPSAFSITGVQGGSDSTLDSALLGLPLEIAWTDSTGEISYEITVLKNDGVTVMCATKSLAANTTTHLFAPGDCGTFEDGLIYKINLKAIDALNQETSATNSPFLFSYHIPASSYAEVIPMKDQVPISFENTDTASVELGARFKPLVDGNITALRFYKNSTQTTAVTGHLWTSTGTLLRSVSFSGGAAQGWQEATLATPLAVTAGTTYVVSYLAPQGRYAATPEFFNTAFSRYPIYYFADNDGGRNGLFDYSGSAKFPTSTFGKANYFADIVFQYIPAPEIRGVFGGVDNFPDALLTDGVVPSVTWSPSPNATAHDITIFEDDATTVACATASVVVPTSSFSFNNCTLAPDTYYKVTVVGKNGGTSIPASNNSFRFYVGKAPELLPLHVKANGSPNNNVDLTTEYFTPADHSLIILMVNADTLENTNITISVNDSAGLTWTKIIERNGNEPGGDHSYASAWYAKVTTATPMKVSVQRSAGDGGSKRISYAIKNARNVDMTNPIGATGEGSSSTNDLNASGYISTVSNSLGFSAATDWYALGAPTSTDSYEDEHYSGEISILRTYKTNVTSTAGTPVQFNFNAFGASTPMWNWIAFELLPAP